MMKRFALLALLFLAASSVLARVDEVPATSTQKYPDMQFKVVK